MIPEIFLPIMLYAETHYKFKGIYSRLIKNEPEIIADAPHRVEPGQAIPILILIKDAHRFPIRLTLITTELKKSDKIEMTKTFYLNRDIEKERFWHHIFYLEPPDDLRGDVEVDVIFEIYVNNKIKIYKNDNYRISSHQSLKVYLAEEPLPRFENWYLGDFHYHSNYTEDQVEFGAPLEATVQLARALGLDFFAVTDHSYDLDDREDSWTENDHSIHKWHHLWKEVEEFNRAHTDFVILPGEEVSAGNNRRRNVHLLIVNNRKFLPGKGDSAEQWLRTEPDLSIAEILSRLEDGALAVAGHPEMPAPFLQWLLIRRGRWGFLDLAHPRLNGFQIWNGDQDDSFYDSSSTWVKLLLEGKRLSLIAGNDAHGNFNRFRQIGFPFFTLCETNSQLFGNMRTVIKLKDKLSLNHLLQGIKNGKVQVSNGPTVDLIIRNHQEQFAAIGEEIGGQQLNFVLKVKSTKEFGRLTFLCIISGDLILKKEQPILIMERFPALYYFELNQEVKLSCTSGYIRLELTAQTSGGHITRCLTNPIWIKNICKTV